LSAQRLQQGGGADQVADVVAAYQQQFGGIHCRYFILPLSGSG
jgi:hypothetical protein